MTVKLVALFVAAVVAAGPASADVTAETVGEIVGVEGRVEVAALEGEFRGASIGVALHAGDRIRTGRPGRARLAFQDGSTINVADDSLFSIDEQVYHPEDRIFRSFMQLLRGKVRAIVGKVYETPGSSYEVQTATAISGVRGTAFIVAYDPELEATEVIGISGRVHVRSLIDASAPGVLVTAREITTISVGSAQTRPRLLGDRELDNFMLGLDFVGGGRPESMLQERLQGGRRPTVTKDVRKDVAPQRRARTPTGSIERTHPDQTPGDVLDQPTPVLDDLGGAIVDF